MLASIAWRNLWRRKRRTAITVISIAFGVGLCLFFTGLSGSGKSSLAFDTIYAEGQRRYDLVLNMEVVEHVANLPAFLENCCELTRPGGIMVIATINRTLISWLAAIVGAEYILRWLPRGTHQWSRFPRPSELEAILATRGFSVEDQVGVGVNPIGEPTAERASGAGPGIEGTQTRPAEQ